MLNVTDDLRKALESLFTPQVKGVLSTASRIEKVLADAPYVMGLTKMRVLREAWARARELR